MSAVVETPIDLVESMAAFRFPPQADARLQELMDRNTDGRLSPEERVELEGWVDASERLAIVRARALRVLGRTPS